MNTDELLAYILDAKNSITGCTEAILRHYGRKVKPLIMELDKSGFIEFEKYFWTAVDISPVPRKIKALYFGLFESDEGYNLYFSGSETFNRKDEDFGLDTDYVPELIYSNLKILKKIDKIKNKNEDGWLIALSLSGIIIKNFFIKKKEFFREETGVKDFAVVIGFDDGDLYQLEI